jgi:hypothetical protein
MKFNITVILTCVAICLFKIDMLAAKPVAAVAGVYGNSTRTSSYSLNMESHLLNIIESTGRFNIVKTPTLRNELERIGCTDEKCALRFAQSAKIALLLTGDFEDFGQSIKLTLSAYSTEIPYNGKIVYKATYDIKAPAGMSMLQGAAISEENAAVFISEMLKRYTTTATVVAENNSECEFPKVPDGVYTLYRFDQGGDKILKTYKKIDNVKVKNQQIVKHGSKAPELGDFILFEDESKSAPIKYFYEGRKKEMTILPVSLTTTVSAILLTPLGSAFMPIAAPIFGYYEYADWTGLSLWAINAAPYLYLEGSGFINDPARLRSKNKDISRYTNTNRKFAWYMLFTGGASLFVDAFAQQSLQIASVYGNPQPFIGSQALTAYWSLVSGGGGFFYKGYRSWGYFYFHLNNILMYATLWQFSPQEKYVNDHYIKDKKSKRQGVIFISAYGTVKVVEIVHALLSPVNISSGTLIHEEFALLPYLDFDEKFSPILGISGSIKF